MVTMGKTQIKNVFWLLLADQELFDSWREVCDAWCSGRIPDGKGAKGTARSSNGITFATFREFEGDITRDEKLSIFKAVLAEEVLVKKEAANKSSIPAMAEVAKDIKVTNKLKQVIMQYFLEKHENIFQKPLKWKEMVNGLPALDEDE